MPTPTPTPSGVAVLGLVQSDSGIDLQLPSDGCIKKDQVVLSADGGLHVAELPAEVCEDHWPLGQVIHFDWEELPPFDRLAFDFQPFPVDEPASAIGASSATEEDEELYGLRPTKTALEVWVMSSGCTAKEHFAAWVEPGTVQRLHLARTTPDQCQAVSRLEHLVLAWTELGVSSDRAIVANPIALLQR